MTFSSAAMGVETRSKALQPMMYWKQEIVAAPQNLVQLCMVLQGVTVCSEALETTLSMVVMATMC